MPAAPPARRVDVATSRTAEFTCLSRAASSLETEPHYHSGDGIAPLLLPGFIRALLGARIGRAAYRRLLAPRGMYEYVIARTKYLDAAFRQALAESFPQIVLFGAGFDTRALRFAAELGAARVFELDVPITQAAKIARYRQRRLALPPNLCFVAVDFERDSVSRKLEDAGFRPRERSLFVLEGVLMYLAPASAAAAFRTLRSLAAPGSRVVFDYVRASVLRGEGSLYGEAGAAQRVAGVHEAWHFGLEPEQLAGFLASYGFRIVDHQDAAGLERLYFRDPGGCLAGRVNGTHCIVAAAADS